MRSRKNADQPARRRRFISPPAHMLIYRLSVIKCLFVALVPKSFLRDATRFFALHVATSMRCIRLKCPHAQKVQRQSTINFKCTFE